MQNNILFKTHTEHTLVSGVGLNNKHLKDDHLGDYSAHMFGHSGCIVMFLIVLDRIQCISLQL